MEREGQASQRIAEGCALHGGEPFTAICRGCGTYMCRRCSEDARFDTCATCRARHAQEPQESATSGFAFRRDGVLWGAFLRFCFDVYRKHFWLLTLALAASLASTVALHGLGTMLLVSLSDSSGGELVWLFVGVGQALWFGLLTLGMLEISVRVVQGRPARLSMLLSGAPRLGALVLVGAVMAVTQAFSQIVLLLPLGIGLISIDGGWTVAGAAALAVCTLLGFGLGLYLMLGLVFAAIELVAQPQIGALSALKNAWRIARGERLTIGFGLFLIGALTFVGMLLCGIGLVFTLAYACVLFAALYLALRNGAPGLSGETHAR